MGAIEMDSIHRRMEALENNIHDQHNRLGTIEALENEIHDIRHQVHPVLLYDKKFEKRLRTIEKQAKAIHEQIEWVFERIVKLEKHLVRLAGQHDVMAMD